ncbi:hypothetical protein MATR_11070 [Marivirga tractuosa]|uniref:Co-chaperone DjlA N-terminal domain-containing protein n=1 Tax=Marivirga tractuosa (strain ATCC 23168 / DSM 4126 / NBRC 15989 / NCIMB 1408 / VKM B-1430 / H-43) TaxID=643867 RepID=E4TLE3_MARTH|nr:hypothetical protein [Marivirga tractuosa]ADR21264.1 hypothetical protein Ftrac_1273 [Marivirga tractuosa DSM 4126]BDD14282.1 hypothetical protein MATR_11070 [Marivirga tractuosa]
MKFELELTTEKIYSHLIHLYQLAKIDNRFVKEEKRYLYALGRKNGVAEKEVDEIIDEGSEVKFHEPDTLKEKIIFLYEYIQMMLVDNKLDEREAQMCALIAERMGLDRGLVGSMTNSIVTAKDEQKQPELSDEELGLYINNPDDLL